MIRHAVYGLATGDASTTPQRLGIHQRTRRRPRISSPTQAARSLWSRSTKSLFMTNRRIAADVLALAEEAGLHDRVHRGRCLHERPQTSGRQHYQSTWHERAGDPRLPQWLRVAALAYGSHKANGHSQFSPGQIALVLATVHRETGEVTPLDKGSVQRAYARPSTTDGWQPTRAGGASSSPVTPSR